MRKNTNFDDLEENIFITDERLHKIGIETLNDSTMQTLMNMVKTGFAKDKQNVPFCIREYWPYRDEVSTLNGLLYRGTSIIILA
jgi:hypothetical protein